MKKYIFMLGLAASLLSLSSCGEDDLNPKSIFEDQPASEQNDFDRWILANYTMPYNISLKYHMEDIESDHDYTLAPADFDKSVSLAHIVKYAWLEAYDEVAGIDFTRQYVPKVLHLIGSAAYEDNGTMVLGTAEGGLKVTLYLVNSLQISKAFLNQYYFKTMHHEFAHILHQTKNYDTDYDRISEGLYVSGDWYQQRDADALKKGFISPYAMSEPREDIAEVTSIYITNTAEYWENQMKSAGTSGAAIITQKLNIVKAYMKTAWNIDMDELRDVVQRRMDDVVDGAIDLNSLN